MCNTDVKYSSISTGRSVCWMFVTRAVVREGFVGVCSEMSRWRVVGEEGKIGTVFVRV